MRSNNSLVSQAILVFSLFLLAGCTGQYQSNNDRVNAYVAAKSQAYQGKLDAERKANSPDTSMAQATIGLDDDSLKKADTWEICNAYHYANYALKSETESNRLKQVLKSRKALSQSEWSVMDKPIAEIIGKSRMALLCRLGVPYKINTISTANDSYQYVYQWGKSSGKVYIYVKRGRVTDIN